MKEYYVYGAYVDGVLKYVGKGKKDRYKHCTSGASTCAELNRDLFLGKEIIVKFLAKNLTNQESISLESDMINNSTTTLYNKSIPYKKFKTKTSDVESYKRTPPPVDELLNLEVNKILLSTEVFNYKEQSFTMILTEKILYSQLLQMTKGLFPADITNKELSALTGIKENTISRCNNNLVDKGLVTKETTSYRNLLSNTYTNVIPLEELLEVSKK